MSKARGTPDLEVGSVIDGRYTLKRDLGRGAAGRVFEATHNFTGRSVALKLVAADTPDALRVERNARLTREARALASVRHPGVIDVLDGGFGEDGTAYLVTETLDGRTLEGLLAARGQLSVEDTVATALQLCQALEAAHAVGVIHRDVKPANVLIVQERDRREVVKVVDFGIARVEAPTEEKLTGIGAVIGTPAYMSPEQLLGLDDVDFRSDVYSLGVLLFECLTGYLPYEGNYQRVILDVCSAADVPRVTDREKAVPGGVVEVVFRAMTKDRAGRFSSMSELAKALLASFGNVRKQTYFFSPPPIPASELAKPAAPPPGAQRRKLVRASYVTPVRLVIGNIEIDGRTEDISTGGLLVICRQVCPTERGSLRFALPMDGKVATLDAQVRWVRAAKADDPEGPRALGVEFIDPPAEMTASIAKYVSFMTVPEAAS